MNGSRILLAAALFAAACSKSSRNHSDHGTVDEVRTPVAPAPAPAGPTPPTATPTPAPTASGSFPADCSVTAPSQADHDILWGTESDQRPKVLDGVSPEKYDQHYYVSDEGHAEQFKPYIENAGGGYVGIGSDQAYLYIGWQKPQVAWTIDYDPEIVNLHRIQQAFILAADTPDEYKALWLKKDHRKQATQIVDGMSTDAKEVKRLKNTLAAGQARFGKRWGRVISHVGTIPTYLTDQASYDWLRAMIKNGCVRPMLVDLLAPKGMKGIAEAAQKVGIPIRVVYLSNAEEYWTYNDQFRDNIRGLPGDEHSRVLHTQYSRTNHDYRYTAQPLDNFVKWLDHKPHVGSAAMMIKRLFPKNEHDFPSQLFDDDPDAKPQPKKKKSK